MLKVLYVCTANISRSPSAAAVLQDAGLPGVEVRSAGVAAAVGSPGCAMAPALAGRTHASQPLTFELVQWADLILTAASEHQAAVLAIDPSARTRTFTIRQAGRLSQWLVASGMLAAARSGGPFAPGDPRNDVEPLPDAAGRGRWLVSELDAARGMAPVAPEQPARRRRRDSGADMHPDDVPDPHVLGMSWHDTAARQIEDATKPLVEVVRELAAL